jgi:hypothetical protein
MTITLSPAGLFSADRSIRHVPCQGLNQANAKRKGLKSPGSQHPSPPSWEDLLGRR